VLAHHAPTLAVLYTDKECLEVTKKYLPTMSGLEELYLGGRVNEEVRTLVPLVEAGYLPRLRLLWIEEVRRELLVQENLLDLATCIARRDNCYNDTEVEYSGMARNDTTRGT